ncbi:unnamed protein product, partial [marine sediment metagenome]
SILIAGVILFAAGCAEFQALVAGGKERARETAAAAVETTEAALESGESLSRAWAETAETPWGMIGGWIANVGFVAALAGCAWLKRKLGGSMAALGVVTDKVNAGVNDSEMTIATKKMIRVAVKAKMDGESNVAQAALKTALDGPGR